MNMTNDDRITTKEYINRDNNENLIGFLQAEHFLLYNQNMLFHIFKTEVASFKQCGHSRKFIANQSAAGYVVKDVHRLSLDARGFCASYSQATGYQILNNYLGESAFSLLVQFLLFMIVKTTVARHIPQTINLTCPKDRSGSISIIIKPNAKKTT